MCVIVGIITKPNSLIYKKYFEILMFHIFRIDCNFNSKLISDCLFPLESSLFLRIEEGIWQKRIIISKLEKE